MAEKRPHDFEFLLRFQGKKKVKIHFYSAAHWPNKGGKKGLFRLKVSTYLDKTGTYSERWYPAPHQYDFLTQAKAWELVKTWSSQPVTRPEPIPNIPPKTRVRVFNGNIFEGEKQYDLTWTLTKPVRLSDGRVYVVVLLPGKGHEHVPLSDISTMEEKQ